MAAMVWERHKREDSPHTSMMQDTLETQHSELQQLVQGLVVEALALVKV